VTPERLRQVEELYHAAREDRAALDQADPELRREVESLLAQDGVSLPSLNLPTVTQVAVGTLLGPYRIEALLGQGGMGQVYRAVDTRLDRKVAIKISAQQFSDRFEREARAISALNHPHICTLYDVGPNYLVMELVEGKPLKGPLPLDQALRYGAEIADALAAAHAKGIVHRDLKPGNIMVTKSGVKVLDFGLAKSQQDDNLTVTNAVMGTPKYMAPEQREGKECDARTDIYALGLVLREMAADFPSYVIDRCLEKDPDDRWQSAHDVKLAVGQSSSFVPSGKPNIINGRLPYWIAAGVAVLAAAVGWWLHSPHVEPRPVTRWTAALPATSFEGSGVSISRDGTRLAYNGGLGNSRRIWVRSLDQREAKPVPGTEGGFHPFFSPDGQWLAYFTGQGGSLKKVPVTGGTPITLCEDAYFAGGSWDEDDRIIFSGSSGGMIRVSASGGACESLTRPDPQKRELHHYPQILPGGQSVLFTIGTLGLFDSGRIAALDLKSGGIRVLVNGGMRGLYVPTGHLVYVRGGTLFAVPFDLKRLTVTGPETPVIERVFYIVGGGFADYAFSDSGLLVYREDTRGTLRTFAWLDRKGTPQASSAPPQDYQHVRLSPDGQHAAVAVRRVSSNDIWILELARGALTRVTDEGTSSVPVWTPDGRRVVFGWNFGTSVLRWAPADGSGKPEVLLEGQAALPDSWMPDGKTLLYESFGPSHIWTLQPSASGGDGKPRLLSEASSFNESDAQISLDGRWVAYTSDESGKNRVYVRPFPGPGGKTPISIEGGQEPRWSRDGRELLYRDPEKNQLMAVDIQTSPAFRAGQPHALFALGNVPWDVAPDGKRFLVVKEPEAAASEAKMQAVVNWFEELRQKAPANKK
jgi:Tol biopolymer transport system component/predicted Ser/Thr protein kinase